MTHDAQVREAAEELGYQATDTFCLKVSQLREIFNVRWSVFLLGPAGCGKTAIWRTLMRTQQLLGEKTIYKPINPKVGYLDGFRDSTLSNNDCRTCASHPWEEEIDTPQQKWLMGFPPAPRGIVLRSNDSHGSVEMRSSAKCPV